MRVLQITTLLAVFIACASDGSGQVTTGSYPYGIFDNKGFDTINVGNLNVHFSIPVFSKAGRQIPFNYNLSYDSSVWYPGTNSSGQTQWEYVSDFGWRGDTESIAGYMTFTQSGSTYTNFTYHDSLGVPHLFYSVTTSSSSPTATGNAADNSGYSLSVTSETNCVITTRTGQSISVPNSSGGSATFTDNNGNEITADGAGNLYDTLSSSTPVLTITGVPPAVHKYQYTNPEGGTSAVSVGYTTYTVATNFGVSGIAEYPAGNVVLVSLIHMPDGSSYSFTYEQTPGTCTPHSGTFSSYCITGRIASVTLPTGGTISYTYSLGNNGIFSDGSTAGLHRSDGTAATQYNRSLQSGLPGPGTITTTTFYGQDGNYKVDNFIQDYHGGTNNLYPTEEQYYQGAVSPSNLVSTVVQCYNGDYSSCATNTALATPFSQIDTYSQLPNGSTRLSELFYDSYGNVLHDYEYNYGVSMGAAPSSSYLVRETDMTYNHASGTNGTFTELATSKVYDWSSGSSNQIASASYQYDQGTPASTTGTPQHISVTGNRGNLTEATYSTSGTTSLYQNYTYFDTGNIDTVSLLSSSTAAYTFTYGNCGNSFLTNVAEPISGLSLGMTWNCTGGVVTSQTDENGNSVTATYNQSSPVNNYWRPIQMTDQDGNATTIAYGTSPMTVETAQSFNSGASSTDILTTYDSLGRPMYNQRHQSPTGADYDTSEIDYNNMDLPNRLTMPYAATASPSSSNTTAPATVTTYDPLLRVSSVTDGGGGEVAYTYNNNDVLQAVTGTQSFQKQYEYDGLGRLSSVCEITSGVTGWPSGACGQTNAKTGYLTQYTYDALGHMLTVKQNAQSSTNTQSRSFTYDWLGRMKSETNGETGTISYTWDSLPALCPALTGNHPLGNLAAKYDNSHAYTCYYYDAMNRLIRTQIVSGTGACRNYVYDSSSTPPTGFTINNALGRLVEASTAATCGGTLATDEWFSYSPRGEISQFDESTPHSGGYYSIGESYWVNGAIGTVNGIPGVPKIQYGAGSGMDGEGRYTKVSAATGQFPITSVSYAATSSSSSAVGALTGITFGSGDGDTFTSDPNTGRFTGYTFSVNSVSDSGALTWNSNGTLSQLAISDAITGSTDTQTCAYTYDDLSRLGSSSCGTIGSQTFSYDPFGNIDKSASGHAGVSFQPSYFTSNRINSYPGQAASYDSNGDLTLDNLGNAFTWNSYGGLLTATPSGGSTSTATYDAFGRMVELAVGSTYYQSVYAPGFKDPVASATGTSLNYATLPLPGGAQAVYGPSGLTSYIHGDWISSGRLSSDPSQNVLDNGAYAPFGESYANGPSSTGNVNFSGEYQSTVAGAYDFLMRRYSPSQGRWLSPDPAGLAAVDPTNPQSWNRYAYVFNNPLALIDPLGLDSWVTCDDGGCYGNDDGGCDDDYTACVSGDGPPSPCSLDEFFCGISGLPTVPGVPLAPSIDAIPSQGLLHRLSCSTFSWLTDTTSITHSTMGFGVGGNAGVGFILGVAASAGVQVVADSSGNLGVAISLGGNPGYGVFGVGAMAGIQGSLSSARTIYDLQGPAWDFGASAGEGPAVGADVAVAGSDATLSVTVGPGVGTKGSALAGVYTWVPSALSTNCR